MASVKKHENVQGLRKKNSLKGQARERNSLYLRCSKFTKMNTRKKTEGAAFGDMQRRTAELNKQLEKFGKFYDNFDDLFLALFENYNGFKSFYDELNDGYEAAEDAAKEEAAAKDIAGDISERLEEFKRTNELADDLNELADDLNELAERLNDLAAKVDLARREKEIIGSKLNSKEAFEASPLDDLPPIQDGPATFDERETDETAGDLEATERFSRLMRRVNDVAESFNGIAKSVNGIAKSICRDNNADETTAKTL